MALSKILENSITDGVISAAKLKDFAAAVDLNGVELILDADQDTSITADTDDQIDIKISGADDFRFTANTFTALAGSGIVVPDGGLTFGSTAISATAAEINLIDGGASTGTTAVADADGIITNDGGTMRLTTAATFKTYFQEGISTAYDDLTTGDAAVNIATSAGNITIDAQGNDTDIIFKGTDGGADKTFMTIDGSAGGDLFLTGGLIDLKNDGSAVSQIKFYCESSNAHAQTLIGAPHSESATNTLTLPSTGGNSYLLTAASTATLTNKTLTAPVIDTITRTGDFTIDASGDIILDAAGNDIFLKDAGTTFGVLTNDDSHFEIKSSISNQDMFFKGNDGGAEITALTLDMSEAGAATFNSTVQATGFNIGGTAITSTAAEINLIDGGTSRGTTAVATGDGILINDGGTMRMTNVDTVSTYFSSHNVGGGNIVTTGALNSGSITSGFGNIDTGSSTITTTGAVATGALTTTGASSITTADNLNTLSLISTDADANVGPNLRLYRNSSSPADNDDMGRISFDGRNDNSQDYIGARIWSEASDVSDGTEDAALLFDVMKAGTVNNMLNLNPSEVVFNEAAVDVDFRIESTGDTNAFKMDATNGFIGFGTATPLKMLHITEPSSDCVIILDHNNTETDMQIVMAHHYGTGSNGAHYWGVGVDGSANDFVIAYDASSQASMGADQLLTIQHDGDVNIKEGDLIFGTSGKGVVLGATSNTAANTLADYEEGTWTPTLTCSGSGSFTLDTGANVAAYTKVGRTVHIQASIGVDGESSPDGNLRLSLPFTSMTGAKDIDNSMGNATLEGHGGTIVNGINIFVFGAAYAQFAFIADNGTFDYVDHSHVDTAFAIKFSFTYIAA